MADEIEPERNQDTLFQKLLSLTNTHSQTIIAGFSLLVSCVAIYFTAQSFEYQRQHDRLLVKPEIHFTSYTNKDSSGWNILNKGLGPAKIYGFTAAVDKRIVLNHLALASALGLKKDLMPSGFIYKIPTNGVLFPNESGTFFGVVDQHARKLVSDKHGSLEVSICYCSIYDECWAGRAPNQDSIENCDEWTATNFRSH